MEIIEIIKNIWPIFMYGEDKCGHPICYDLLSKCNPKQLKKCFIHFNNDKTINIDKNL